MPLIDASGSTIALVNAAATQPPAAPQTMYTYDPSGTPTVSGAANLWPFLYKGMEQDCGDAPYYYTGSGQYYSPQLTRSLSEVGQTSTSGPGGGSGGAGGAGGGGFSPAGMMIPLPSGSSGGLSPQSLGNDTQRAFQTGSDIYGTANEIGLSLNTPEATYTLALPLAIIGGAVDFLANFFEDIFGGGSTPEIPRQLRHNRHPLYPDILGVPDGIIVDEMSAGPEETCGDLRICAIRPLADDSTLEIPPQATLTPTPMPTPGPSLHKLWELGKCSGISDSDLLELYEAKGRSYAEALYLVQHRFDLPEPREPGAPLEGSVCRPAPIP